MQKAKTSEYWIRVREDMERLGWGLYQSGPEEWSWYKFPVSRGDPIAVEGDDTWIADLQSVMERKYDAS